MTEAADEAARRLCYVEVELLTQQEALARQRVDVASIFAEHHVGLVRLALIMLGDQASAEDVVQEAFARTHAGRGRLRDADKALAYVRSAVLNGCRSVLRRRATAFRRAVPYEPPVWSAESAAMLGEERREVLLALRELPRRQREALTLRYYFDLTDQEVADTMRISAGTARSTIARGLAALGRALGEES
ncbi:sigma-70 family RNA polymerase sigma factor [Nonomuraea sp. B10E15]|uniref:sigma-70 family RNA polymerase sigma factor n=1 Tax=Nonomuraea sp. B10E15 TaxID=3153560 RepID=UPI00325E32E8